MTTNCERTAIPRWMWQPGVDRPIPGEGSMEVDFGEREPDPPAHGLVGPWAVFHAFDPERDTEEDRWNAAIALRSYHGLLGRRGKPDERDSMLEGGRLALDLARSMREANAVDHAELRNEVVLHPPHMRQPDLLARAKELLAALPDPKVSETPGRDHPDRGTWAACAAYDPTQHTLEEFALVLAACEGTVRCTMGDPDGKGSKKSALRVYAAVKDITKRGEPVTRKAIADRVYFGLPARTRALRLAEHVIFNARFRMVAYAKAVTGWDKPPEPYVEYPGEPREMGYHREQEWQDLHGRARHEPLTPVPPPHTHRGPWAVRRMADPGWHAPEDIELAATALEGIGFFPHDLVSIPRVLAVKALEIARERRMEGPPITAHELAFRVLLSEWPDALADALVGKPPQEHPELAKKRGKANDTTVEDVFGDAPHEAMDEEDMTDEEISAARAAASPSKSRPRRAKPAA